MTLEKRINKHRRKLTRGISRRIGGLQPDIANAPLDAADVKTVLIIRPNHRLGNQLLLTPLVQEVMDSFPGCKIDLFVKGGAAIPVFQNYSAVRDIIRLPKSTYAILEYAKGLFALRSRKYDLVINGIKGSSSGRFLTRITHAKYRFFGDVVDSVKKQHGDGGHFAKSPVYRLRYYLSMSNLSRDNEPVPLMDIKLDADEIARGRQLLDDIVKNDKPTICIYTNATGSKCYSEEWWGQVYGRLQREYPDFNIIEMLPIENISKINFKAPHFYSKDIREMGAIIRNTRIFISADNGVMHLASASLAPTVGFFSETKPSRYEPYGNGSTPIDTTNTDIDDWFDKIASILKKEG